MSDERDEPAPDTVRTGHAGWWISAIVAVLAAIGMFFVIRTQNRQDALQAAQAGAGQTAQTPVADPGRTAPRR